MQVVVQSAGRALFNDGLRKTLRLSFQEYENSNSGEAMARLQKVRGDMECFISGFRPRGRCCAARGSSSSMR